MSKLPLGTARINSGRVSYWSGKEWKPTNLTTGDAGPATEWSQVYNKPSWLDYDTLADFEDGHGHDADQIRGLDDYTKRNVAESISSQWVFNNSLKSNSLLSISGGNMVSISGTKVQLANSAINTGGVGLFHNQVERLTTTSIGVDINGTTNISTDLNVDGNSYLGNTVKTSASSVRSSMVNKISYDGNNGYTYLDIRNLHGDGSDVSHAKIGVIANQDGTSNQRLAFSVKRAALTNESTASNITESETIYAYDDNRNLEPRSSYLHSVGTSVLPFSEVNARKSIFRTDYQGDPLAYAGAVQAFNPLNDESYHGIHMSGDAVVLDNTFNSAGIPGNYGIYVGYKSNYFVTLGGDNANVGIKKINPTESLDINGNAKLTQAFTSGYLGNGTRWEDDGTTTRLTVDELTVRKFMRVYELEINKIRATNGSLWVTDAMESTDVYLEYNPFGDDKYVVTGQDGEDPVFQLGDIIRCQRWDRTNATIVRLQGEVTDIITTGNAPVIKFIADLGESSNWINIKDEETFVRVNSTTNDNRKGALYLTSSDDGAPYMDVAYDETTKLRIGSLAGVSGQYGYGMYVPDANGDEAMSFTSGTSSSLEPGHARMFGWTVNKDRVSSSFNGVNVELGTPSINTAWVGLSLHSGWSGTHVSLVQQGNAGMLIGVKNNSTEFKLTTVGESEISGWKFNNTSIYREYSGTAGDIELSIGQPNNWSTSIIGFQIGTDANNRIWMGAHSDGSYYSIEDRKDGAINFKLGSDGNSIAGWTFDDEKLYSDNLVLDSTSNASIQLIQDTGAVVQNGTIEWFKDVNGTVTSTGKIVGGWSVNSGNNSLSIQQGSAEIELLYDNQIDISANNSRIYLNDTDMKLSTSGGKDIYINPDGALKLHGGSSKGVYLGTNSSDWDFKSEYSGTVIMSGNFGIRISRTNGVQRTTNGGSSWITIT